MCAHARARVYKGGSHTPVLLRIVKSPQQDAVEQRSATISLVQYRGLSPRITGMRNIHTSKSIPAKNQPTNGHMSRSIEDAPSKMGICMNKVALDAYHEGPSGGFCFFFTDLQSIREVLSWRLGRKNWIPAARNIKCHVADCVRADSERMTSTPRRMQNRTMTASAFEQNGRGGKNLTILQVTW